MASSNRKISVIMVADAVGYSKHMEANEDATLASYKECEAILKDLLKKHNGSIFNTGGDSVLTEFSSAVNAVECGVEFQRAIKEKNSKQDNQVNIEFRVGINMGDVVETDGNLLGDGVNIAARLEALSMPGGVSISKSVHDMIVGKTKLTFKNQGLQKVKQNEFYVYDVVIDPTQTRTLKTKAKTSKAFTIGSAVVVASIAAVLFIVNPFKSDDYDLGKIAILPLDNFNQNDQNEKNMAIGLSQDLANSLSRASASLNIIPLSKKPNDLNAIGKETGANYFIDGNLRILGEEIRVNIRLVDIGTMSNIWSQKYDLNLSANNIFKLQDEIINSVVDNLVGAGAVLTKDITRRIETKGPNNLTAYECINFVRGVARVDSTLENHKKAIACLEKTVKEDPGYAEAWQKLGEEIGWGYALFGTYKVSDLFMAQEHVGNAIKIDPNFVLNYTTNAMLFFYQRDWNSLFESVDKAVELAPRDVETLAMMGSLLVWGGNCSKSDILDYADMKKKYYRDNDCRWQLGKEYLLKANKLDQANITPMENFGLANLYNVSEQYSSSINVMRQSVQPGFHWYEWQTAIAHNGLGNLDQAQKFFDDSKKTIGSSKLVDVLKHFQFWNMDKTYFEIYKEFFVKYGFEE